MNRIYTVVTGQYDGCEMSENNPMYYFTDYDDAQKYLEEQGFEHDHDDYFIKRDEEYSSLFSYANIYELERLKDE